MRKRRARSLVPRFALGTLMSTLSPLLEPLDRMRLEARKFHSSWGKFPIYYEATASGISSKTSWPSSRADTDGSGFGDVCRTASGSRTGRAHRISRHGQSDDPCPERSQVWSRVSGYSVFPFQLPVEGCGRRSANIHIWRYSEHPHSICRWNMPLSRDAKDSELGCRWLKADPDSEYVFVIGTQYEADEFRRAIKKPTAEETPSARNP